MTSPFSESVVEDIGLKWLRDFAVSVSAGPSLARLESR
jgi:hypothetical protein